MTQSDTTATTDKDDKAPEKAKEVLDKELTNAITQVLSQYEGDELEAQKADLFILLNRLEPDFQEPAVEQMQWSNLNDKTRCSKLRLDPEVLDVGTYLQNGYIEQTVYLTDSISVTYRSARPLDSQFLDAWAHITGKRYEEASNKKDLEQGDILHLMDATPSADAMNELALSVQQLNGRVIGDIEDIYLLQEDGRLVPQLELAEKKRLFFDKMALDLVTDITINMRLFNKRVHGLHAPEAAQAF